MLAYHVGEVLPHAAHALLLEVATAAFQGFRHAGRSRADLSFLWSFVSFSTRQAIFSPASLRFSLAFGTRNVGR